MAKKTNSYIQVGVTTTSDISSGEPFERLYNQGMVLGPDGQKMSKSKGNVINPDDAVKEYGADCLRMYEMFMGPFVDNKPWSTTGIRGVYRFLGSVWKMIEDLEKDKKASQKRIGSNSNLKIVLNLLIKNIDEKIPNLQFNTCVSDFMKFVNDYSEEVYTEDLKIFLKLLFPFAPIISAEGLSILGESTFLDDYYNLKNVWPKFDPEQTGSSETKIKVMISNKFRGDLEVTPDVKESEVLEILKNDQKFTKYLPQTFGKIVYIPGKIINII